ncbi:N-acetyltransferase family protein [Flavobacterium sp. KACC 22761]|uniref:GNAT family N-acetyltransferase n=1 Tax=Flavobacterium sp. KACC 22761 TaxID=3092665 RepID=UPI002A74BB31|nr:N-acetyltransferase family protein [Flavobacterium sp. KACC 22761]WPO78872.1 GNAT family N-acetyltransferase [Flavobacterium sp. KACC 22761]
MKIVKIKSSDYKDIQRIYNYYVLKTPFTFSDDLMKDSEAIKLTNEGIKYAGYIALKDEMIIGFGIAYPFRVENIFSRTIKLTYFLNPAYLGKGIGTKILNQLFAELKEKGFRDIIVNISSLNKSSIEFHKKKGFVECGFFQNIGIIKGQEISMVWMQKKI